MLTLRNYANIMNRGRVAEWLMALVLKTSKLIASQVRILSLPPGSKNSILLYRVFTFLQEKCRVRA